MLLKHNGENIDCDKCSFSCMGKQNMISHNKKNHSKSHQSCNICQKDIRKKTFQLHIRTHDKSKSFSCVKCSAVFVQHEYLKRHIRHTCEGYREDELLLKLESSFLENEVNS